MSTLRDLATLLAILAAGMVLTSPLFWAAVKDARRWAARRVTDALWGSWG